MKTIQWRTCALAVLLPLSALANTIPADPTDAAVGVPAPSYDSAFKTYQPVAEESATPDKAWRSVNDAVAAKPGDDHMMGMQMDQPMKMPMPGMAEGSSNQTMVMQDGTTMPMGVHDHKHPDEGMKMPNGSTMPMEQGMKMPMPMPLPKREIAKPKQRSVAKPMDKMMKMPDGSTMPMDQNMKMPLPKADSSMPGMDMSHGHDGKGN